MVQISEEGALRKSLISYFNSLGSELDSLAHSMDQNYRSIEILRSNWGAKRAEYEELRALLYGGGVCQGPFWDELEAGRG